MWTRIILPCATFLLAQAILFSSMSTQMPAADGSLRTQQRKEPAPPTPRISVAPGSLLMFEGRTAGDIPIDYDIDGDLSQVTKATLEITNDSGNVLLTTEVPVLPKGHYVWAKGVRMETSPDTLSFQVHNPEIREPTECFECAGYSSDSEKIEVQAEENTGDNPTQVLLSLFPARVVRGVESVLLTLKGRNFRPNTEVTLKLAAGDETRLKAEFINSTTLRARLPGRFLSKVQEWSVEILQDGFNNSDELSLQVVPEGLPLAPTLDSVKPSQLRSSENPEDKWILLRGRNFVKGNSKVFVMDYPEELETKFISSLEIKALLPRSYLSGPQNITIHVESASDPFLASRHLPLEILTIEGHHTEPFDSSNPQWSPQLITVNDGSGYLVLPPMGAIQRTVVILKGRNFTKSAVVLAQADLGEDHPLKTIFISPTKLQAILPTDIWGARGVNYSLKLQLKDESQRSAEAVP